jgi:Phosphotransferase enzyme family
MSVARQMPASSQYLTAAGMTEALRRAGVLDGAAVRSLSIVDLGTQGVAGRVARARIVYDRPPHGAPASLIAKFPAAAGPTRDLAIRLRLYEREAAFYRSLAGEAGVPVPRAYGYTADAAAPVLLIEDLAPSVSGDLVTGCSLDRAAVIVEHMARMHARWWDSPELDAQAWLPRPVDSAEVLTRGGSAGSHPWSLFRKRFGRAMPAEVLAIGDRVTGDASILRRLSCPPLTLIHGDLRADNVMFDPDETNRVTAIIDWQTASRGRAAIDIATFFVTSLTREDRRAAEAALLPAYVAALARAGVRDFSLEQCRTDYRLAILNQFCETVYLATMIDVANEVRDDVGAVTGARLMAALLDLDMTDLLPAGRRWALSLAGVRRRTHRRLPAPLGRSDESVSQE